MKNYIPVIAGLSLAVTSATTAAQSNVSIYGGLDSYVAVQTASGTSGSLKTVGSGYNPNALGFAGVEDLGSGLKVGFILEGQPLLDTGAMSQGGKFFGRQSLIHASGAWGRIGLGRQHTPGRAFGIKYAPSGWLATDPVGNLQLAMGASISAAMNVDTVAARLSNSVAYTSPVMSGLSFTAIQSASEGGQFSAGQAKVSMLGLNYASSMLDLDIVVSRIPAIAGSQIAQTDYGLGATYKAAFGKLMVSYQAKRGYAVSSPVATAPLAGSHATDHMIGGGGQLKVGELGTFGVGIAYLKAADEHRGQRQANLGAPFSSIMDNATAWSLSYTHALSKRTQLFAAYGDLANDGVGTASLAPGMRPTPGGTSRSVAGGLRHSF